MMKTEILSLFRFTDLGNKIASPLYFGDQVHNYFKNAPNMLTKLKTFQNPCLQIFFYFEDDFSEIPVTCSYTVGDKDICLTNASEPDDMSEVLDWLISQQN